jgi:hypothetical protein
VLGSFAVAMTKLFSLQFLSLGCKKALTTQDRLKCMWSENKRNIKSEIDI